MAYPFLPVNPCCTDVVLNTPCGCSSTITNSGCNDNNPCSTHLTASSTIVYDGPTLPCIVAEPCDTLNVILQKIDEIICNLQTQINYLTNQVTNITNQIIMINGDIINIYNTLGECCGATTTTTSTTTAAPCESFSLNNTGVDPVAIIITDCITGEPEAIVLMPGDTNICVETDSPLTVPGSIIVTPNGPCGTSTTTTTSTSSTTTTTTTGYPCECLTFYNNDVVSHDIYYTDCFGVTNAPIPIQSHETIQVCGCCGFASDEFVTITVGANCIDGLCPSPTTTTTTTALCNCFDTEITITSEALAITDDGQITVLYQDCLTNPYLTGYDKPGVYAIGCVNYLVGITALGMVDGVESSIYVPITVGNPCCEGTTTTTSSTSSTTSTSTSSTTTTSTTAYVLACTAGYTGPVGFPNRTTGNGSMTLGSGLTINTTYTGPALLTGFQPPFTNCVGGYFGGNVGIGGSIGLNYNSGAFTFTITYSVPQTAVKFVVASIGYVSQPGVSEYYTITTDSTNTVVNLIAGCGDFRVEAPNVVAGSYTTSTVNTGGNVEVVADAPFTTITITGNNPGSLAGTIWDMYICDAESTTTTTSSTSTSSTTTTTTTSEPTTTTTTTCNPATPHPFNITVVNGTSTVPDSGSFLVDACAAIECLQTSSCTITSSFSVYFDVASPGIGDIVYAGATGCTLGLVGYDGYFQINYGGIWTVVQIINSVIVDFPTCTTTTTTTVVCGNFSLQGLFGGGSWDALDCYTGLPVSGNIPGGDTQSTGCIITSSLTYFNLDTKGDVPCDPTTTTTTTSGVMLASATISSTSNVTDACGEVLDTACWVSNIGGGPGSESVSASSIIYTDAGGTTLFIGNGEFYHVQIDLSSVSTSCEIDSTGNVISPIALCP